MDRQYYRDYFHLERGHWWFLARKKILEDQVEKFAANQHGYKILNTGAATGATSEMLAKYGTVISLEYDKSCCCFLREISGIPVVNDSITEMRFEDNSFDLVCSFDVIEHVQDSQKALSELQRVCRSSGHIFITVPAFMDLWSEHDLMNHHFRRYTVPVLKKIFQKNKHLSISYISYFNTILFIPIYLVRKTLGMIRNTQIAKQINRSSCAPNFSIMNGLLQRIFYMESILLNKRWFLPFGVSIMAILKKS